MKYRFSRGRYLFKGRFLLSLLFLCFFSLVPFFAFAANEKQVTVVGGPYSLSGAWGGALNSGSSAEIRSVNVQHRTGTAEGSLIVVSGDVLTFLYTPDVPGAVLDGGIFTSDALVGKFANSLNSESDCSADPSVFSIGADQYAFVLCGVQPSFSLSSNNAGAVSCSGVACTASGVGMARITATINGVPVKVWGQKNADGWQEFVSTTLPSATLTWDVSVVAPPTLTFSASAGTDPLNPLPNNTSTALSWSTTNADFCLASGDWSNLVSPATSGSGYDTGNLQAQRSYTLECTGPSGDTVKQMVTIYVGSPNSQPTISLSAGSNPVVSGSSTTLSWSTTNADFCLASGDWSNLVSPATSGSGYNTGSVTTDKTYILTCFNSTSSSSKQITITTNASTSPPSSRYFEADPYSVLYDGSTELSWDVRNAYSNGCVASSNASPSFLNWNGSVPVVGNRTISGLTSTTEFTLSCTGAGGTTLKKIEVLVAPKNLPPPALVFYADKEDLNYGESTVIHWKATGADYCYAYDGTDDWYSQWWGSDTEYDYPTGPLVTTEMFTLKFFDAFGQEVEASKEIRVGVPNGPLTLSFDADRYTISSGEGVTLTWHSENATSCVDTEVDVASGDMGVYSKSLSGDFTDYPPVTRTYIMTCSNASDSISIARTVVVDPSTIPSGPPSPPEPEINSWAENDFVPYNTATVLHWEVKNADTCIASADPATSNWVGSKNPVSGLASTGNIRQMNGDNYAGFYLECEGAGGTSGAWVWIEVGHPSLPGPSLSFWADVYAVPSGGSTSLKWRSDADWCEASGDWSGSRIITNDITGMGTGVITEPKTYFLRCGKYSGGSVLARVDIAVGSVIVTPSLGLWADNSAVPSGGSTVLRWNASNVSSCVASVDPLPVFPGWNGSVSFIGGKEIGPLDTSREYVLTCVGIDGNSIQARTSVGVGTTFGSGPRILNFSANASIVQSGDAPTFLLSTADADECCLARGTFSGLNQWNQCLSLGGGVVATNGIFNEINTLGIIQPITNATTYSMVCRSAAWPGSETSQAESVEVGRILLCPASTDRSIILGNTLQFDAWYTENSSADCSTVAGLGGIDVTDSSSFETSWSVVSGGVTAVSGSPGLFRGTSPGPAKVRVTHRPNAALNFFSEEADLVVGRPVTCYRCDTSSFSCSSETQFDFVNDPAQCSSDTFGSSSACRFSCFKDRWEEVAP